MEQTQERLRRLVVAYELLDSSWRREHSFTANEKLVITYLAANGALAPTDLSELVGITSAGISTLLDRLEAGGFIVRRRNPSDGRRVLVTLTKRALQARLGFEAVNEEVAASVSPADEAVIDAFLQRAEEIIVARAGRRLI